MLKNLEYWFDYIIGYIMTSPRNLPFYHSQMYKKWGTRYCSEEQFQQYWDQIPEDY